MYSDCRKRQEGTRRAWPAVRQLFLVQAENFDGDSMAVGTNSGGSGAKKKVCESCGTVGNSDPLPHSAGTEGLHVGYQQNRRRGKAKPIIWVWDQYVCVSVFGGQEVWSPGEAKNHRPQNAFKLQKISPQILLLFALFRTICKRPKSWSLCGLLEMAQSRQTTRLVLNPSEV